MTLCTSLTRSRFFHSLRRLCVGAQIKINSPFEKGGFRGITNPAICAEGASQPEADVLQRRMSLRLKPLADKKSPLRPFAKGGMREMWVMISLSMGRKRRGCPDLSRDPAEKKVTACDGGCLHVWFEFL